MKKYIITAFASILLLTPTANIFAEDTISTTNNISELSTSLQNIIKKYDDLILKLTKENEDLKKQVEELNKKINTPTDVTSTNKISSSTTSVVPNTNSWITLSKASSVEKYNKIIDRINLLAPDIFVEYWIGSGSSIGLFEFVEPNSFFISIDDGKNPAGVTAFARKVLYSYTEDLQFTVIWVFELDYRTQFYITKFGKNPFTKSNRIRIKNPIYKGKLLDNDVATWITSNTGTTTKTPISSSTVDLSNVTIDSVKKAYSNNKILDALKLSSEYIKKDPTNIEVLKIRYRSFHILGKYSEAMKEIQNILEITWESKIEKIVVCDGKNIAKLIKNTQLQEKFTNLCNKK